MSDIGVFFNNNIFDLGIDNGDLASDNTLETSILVSIFTDRRVTDEQLPIGHRSKRGWWGDLYPDAPNDRIGSRLWTLLPGKVTTDTLRLAEDYTREAMQWMIDDGVCSIINVKSEYNNDKHLLINLVITRPDGSSAKYQANWNNQELRRA